MDGGADAWVADAENCRLSKDYERMVQPSESFIEVANAGIETYAERGLSWPCGAGGGETPSLMLGLAGIGLFYLRLRDQAMPSALILRREDFSNLQRLS